MPSLDDEIRVLRQIKRRWSPPHMYLHPSILSYPCSNSGGIREAIFWLQESALCWPSANSRDEEYERRIAELETAASYAIMEFDEFRTVESTIGEGCIASLYPRHIREAVQKKLFEMLSTSRFLLSSSPTMYELHGRGFAFGWQLGERPLAAVLSLACCFRALIRLKDIIDLWASEFKYRTRPSTVPHFYYDFGNPQWESLLYELRVEPSNVAFESERRLEAITWIQRARDWLNFIDEMHWAKSAFEYDNKKAASAKRSDSAKLNQDWKKTREAENRRRVLAAFGRLQPSQRGRNAIGTIAKITGLSRPTIAKFLSEANLK